MTRGLPRLCAAIALAAAATGCAGGTANPAPAAAERTAVTAPPAAPATPTRVNVFAADITDPGVIDLHFFGADGAPVVFYERIGTRRVRLGTRTGPRGPYNVAAIMRRAATWLCGRQVRSFEAASTLRDGVHATGTYTVRTPTCATRFDVGFPRRVAPGARFEIRVTDRWGNGAVTPRLCVAPPRAALACRELHLPRAVTVATRRFRATKAGRWRVELRIRDHRVRRTIAVGRGVKVAALPPTVLVTGDSMIMGVDGFLADELGDSATLVSEIKPGTGFSKPDTPWRRLPGLQTTRLRPAATVFAIGVNEGFAMRTPAGARYECCGEGWVAEYSRRVRAAMLTYRRQGRGRVVWLTLPLPQEPLRRPAADAVTEAIVRAGQGLDGVTVLRGDLVFSPGGYQEVIRFRGRSVHVREVDGIHLNVAGTEIAAKLIAEELARD